MAEWLSVLGVQLPNSEGYSVHRYFNSLNISDVFIVYIDSVLSSSCMQLPVNGVTTSLSLTFD